MPSVTLITYFYVAGWPRSLGSHEVTTQRVSPVILKIMGANILVSRHRPARVTWPFDSPGAISDRCSIVTESLSPTIFEIMDIFYIWVTTLTWRHRLHDQSTPICHFLLVSHCNQTSISNRFRDIRPTIPVRAHAHTHTETRRKRFYILSHAMYCICRQ